MIWNFVRHGQTDYNRRHLFQGRLDIPLNETGRQQALEAGERMRLEGISFVRVYSSPLKRAIETAEIISSFPQEKIIIDERLSEMEFGAYDGTAFDADTPFLHTFFHDPASFVPAEGMESYEAILARTGAFLEDLRRDVTPGDDNILVQTHGACMRALLSHLDHLTIDDFWQRRVGNCEFVRYRIDAPEDTPVKL